MWLGIDIESSGGVSIYSRRWIGLCTPWQHNCPRKHLFELLIACWLLYQHLASSGIFYSSLSINWVTAVLISARRLTLINWSLLQTSITWMREMLIPIHGIFNRKWTKSVKCKYRVFKLVKVILIADLKHSVEIQIKKI